MEQYLRKDEHPVTRVSELPQHLGQQLHLAGGIDKSIAFEVAMLGLWSFLEMTETPYENHYYFY